MTEDLLSELNRLGVKLRLVEGRLDVIAPPGTLTPELRDRLREGRKELVETLRDVSGDAPAQPAAGQGGRHDPFPLTDIQHAYWVGRRPSVELGGVSTHIYFERERVGLDVERLEHSLRQVVDRHEMLRAVVLSDGTQRILPEVPPYRIRTDDLRGLADGEAEARLALTREAMDHQVMPADRWPLFDVRASLLAGGRVRLHIGLDILIMDGFSMFVLFQDWRRFYEDPHWAPEPLRVSFREHVLTEESARDGARHRRAEEYWKERVPDLPPAPALPLAVHPGQVQRPRFTHRHGRLDRERWQAVKDAARAHGTTPSTVLMAGYADVLCRWSQQPDLTLNLTLLQRPQNHPDMERLIGDFTSVTLLAVREQPGESFAARTRQLQEQLLQNLDHTEFNGVRVLRELARRGGGAPGNGMPVVFTSMLLSPDGEDPSSAEKFFGELVHQISQTPQVWLDHQVTEEDGDLVYNWDALEELFPEGVLDEMFAAFGGLLARLADDADTWDATELVPLPTGQARERAEVNATGTPVPEGTLPQMVADRARRCPDAVAVIAGDGQQFTYRQTTTAANRLAHRLAEAGAARDKLVGVVLEKGFEQVAAVLGVTASGAAYLPVDPHWPLSRRNALLEQGEARIVVTTPTLREALGWPKDVTFVTVDTEDAEDAEDPGPLPGGPAPADLAYVIFTSGSTGRPKGVMTDHRGAVNTLTDINRRHRVGPGDRVLSLSALSFDLSVYDVFGVLAAGGTVVLPSPSRLHDPTHWADLVRRHQVTVWNSVPALMQAWTESQAPAETEGTALRLVLLSGDWIPVRLPDDIRALHPGAAVISLGGATEASVWSVTHPVGDIPPEWTRIPYGRPLANQTLAVCDARLRPCPVWVPGEILIGGTGVARGYWRDPQRTAERFVTHPDTGERLYRTGDLGRYLPGGDVELLGRMDFQVKLNGYRVELGEIEAALRARPGVADAVASVPAGARQLLAHVVRRAEAAAAPEDDEAEALRKQLADVLPSYMVPHHVVFVDRFPLSSNGKVDRSALPAPRTGDTPAERTEPRNDTELRLFQLWTEALGHSDFGVHDNFFELGGDSLHAVRILSRIRKEEGLAQDEEEDLEMLFDNPTVAELAVRLSSRTES